MSELDRNTIIMHTSIDNNAIYLNCTENALDFPKKQKQKQQIRQANAQNLIEKVNFFNKQNGKESHLHLLKIEMECGVHGMVLCTVLRSYRQRKQANQFVVARGSENGIVFEKHCYRQLNKLNCNTFISELVLFFRSIYSYVH